MAQPARFNFDLDLADRKPVRPLPRAPAGIGEDEVERRLAEAREAAYAEGMRAGEQNATAMAAQTLASAAATLATDSARSAEALDAAMRDHLASAVQLSATIGRKLALHLVARYPAAELEALIAESMTSLSEAPHLVVRCHPDIADAIRDTATSHMQTSGFSGRLIVMGDPDIRLGDGRLEWVDGGLVRDISEISGGIDAAISAYLAARGVDTNEEPAP